MSYRPTAVKQEPVVLFVHIPKAAGSTLRGIISRIYAQSEYYLIDGSQPLNEFNKLANECDPTLKIIAGHMPFGLHRFIQRPAKYITILRDPVDRVVSHYYFVLRTPHHYLYEQVTKRNLSLHEYVTSSLSSELNNGQTRLLSGIEEVDSVHGHGPCTSHTLEVAKENLTTFSVAGLSERFPETVSLIKTTLGWNFLYYANRNVTSGRPSVKEISKSTQSAIEKANELDIELYAHAKTLFEKQVGEQGRLFQLHVEASKMYQRLARPPHRLYLSTKRFMSRIIKASL